MASKRKGRPPVLRHDSVLSVHESPKSRSPLRSPTKSALSSLNASTSPLLRLPAEIRLEIYALLTPPARLPTIARSHALGVSSVSHRPPPLSFLLSCKQLCAEALDVYYAKAVFRLEGLLDSGNVWALWQVETALLQSPILERMRRVEIVGFWHHIPEGGVVNLGALVNLYNLESEFGAVHAVGQQQKGMMAWPYGRVAWEEVCRRRERIQRVVDVLVLATELRSVVVTWKEIGRREGEVDEGWEVRRECLRSLEKLRGWVRFKTGDLLAREDVVEGVTEFVKELNG